MKSKYSKLPKGKLSKTNKMIQYLTYDKLKYYLVINNMTIQKLAQMFSVSKVTMSKIVKDIKNFDIENEKIKYNESKNNSGMKIDHTKFIKDVLINKCVVNQ